MISLGEYFGGMRGQADRLILERAGRLVIAVNKLIELAEADGVAFPINPATGSQISGKTYGGFRPKDCPVGAQHSKHKMGAAVDLFDPLNAIDDYCLANSEAGGKLEQCGIYMEHPDDTNHWAHWSTIAPASGNRVFHP